MLIGAVSNGATMTAGNSAVVTASFTGIGGADNGTGTLTIDNASWTDGGADTTAPFAGDMVVGGALSGFSGGGGTLIVTDHAALIDQGALIAANPAASGLAQVEDGGMWSIAGNLTIGDGGAGPALLQVQTGTSLGLGGQLSVGGAIMLRGGTLDVSGGSTGSARTGLNVSGGTVNVDAASLLNIGTASPGGAQGLVVDAGATATLDGGTLQGQVSDNGEILVGGTSTIDAGTLVGTGTLALQAGATLTILDPGTLTPAIAFQGSGGDLALAAGPATGLVSGLAGNTIDLPGVTYDAAMPVGYNPATGILTLGGGTFSVQATFDLGTGLSLVPHTARDAGIGTEITACYAEGTRLATPSGDVPVEALRPGDAVLALEGEAWVARPVRWVGRSTVDLARHPRPARAAPVRVAAHAFAPGVPSRDLWLSPEHAVFVDGALVPAAALLNGATVTQEFPARVTYWHVELDRHAVLCAQGLPAESYLDTGNRAVFDGEAGARPLHPEFAAAAAWDERACAPLLLGGARVAAVHTRLLARAQALGAALTADAGLTIERDGARARLRSRSFVPAWLGLGPDRRRLGVAVASVRLDGRPLPRAAFGQGWHAPEPGLRWTDGDALLYLPRPGRLSVRCAPVAGRYWAEVPRAA